MSKGSAYQARFFDRSTPPHLLTLVLIAGIPALSMNMFLPSMPAMAEYFGTEYGMIQFAVSAYLGLTGLFQIFIGPLSDRYGRRNVLLGSFAMFSLATLGCLLAPNVEIFLAFRLMQASVATGIALSRAIIRDVVPMSQAASLIGYVTMGMVLMPMLGPVLGGWMEAVWGWKATFVFLLAGGVAMLALTWADVGETNRHRSTSFAAQFALYPELFGSRRFWGYAVLTACASGAFFAFLGGAPFVATYILKLAPQELGYFFAFIGLGYMIGNFLTGRFAARSGARRMLICGALISVSGPVLVVILFGLGFQNAYALFGSIFFVGLGNGLTIPSGQSGMLSVRPELAGTASGLGGAVMIGGGAVLAAVTGALLTVESGAWPLIFMMLGSLSVGLLATLYTLKVERDVAATRH